MTCARTVATWPPRPTTPAATATVPRARPWTRPDQVFAYLGRYTHRVAISNHRLLAVTDDAVTIATRDDHTATMAPIEFIRRFLQHVVPTGFVRIRHYGLWASSNVHTKLPVARQRLGGDEPAPTPDAGDALPDADWRQLLAALTGIDLAVCPACGSRRLERQRVLPQRPATPGAPRAPPVPRDR